MSKNILCVVYKNSKKKFLFSKIYKTDYYRNLLDFECVGDNLIF